MAEHENPLKSEPQPIRRSPKRRYRVKYRSAGIETAAKFVVVERDFVQIMGNAAVFLNGSEYAMKTDALIIPLDLIAYIEEKTNE